MLSLTLTRIIYLILFILLLIHPHFITGDIFLLPQAHAQSLATLLLAGLALIVYAFDIHAIRKKEEEKKQIEDELQISSERLSEAYKYLGVVNRRLPLLSNITTDFLKRSKQHKKGKKKIFEELLSTATVSLANTSWGMFRFVEIKNEQTKREFIHVASRYTLLKFKIGNNELLQSQTLNKRIVKIDDLYVLATSDDQAKVKCFFVFPQGENNIESELSTLQAIVDQAQLLYQYLYESLEVKK